MGAIVNPYCINQTLLLGFLPFKPIVVPIFALVQSTARQKKRPYAVIGLMGGLSQ